MRSPKNKELFGSLRLFGSTPRNRPHRLLMSPVPGGERKKKKCSRIFDNTAPRLPASSTKHRRNKQEPATCAATDTKRWSRTIRASGTSTWRSATGQSCCGSSTPVAAPTHPIPFDGKRPCNYATAWRPRVPGPLVSGSLSPCSACHHHR